jgi:hypothetical protein
MGSLELVYFLLPLSGEGGKGVLCHIFSFESSCFDCSAFKFDFTSAQGIRKKTERDGRILGGNRINSNKHRDFFPGGVPFGIKNFSGQGRKVSLVST